MGGRCPPFLKSGRGIRPPFSDATEYAVQLTYHIQMGYASIVTRVFPIPFLKQTTYYALPPVTRQRRRKQVKSDQAMGVVYNGRGLRLKLFIDYVGIIIVMYY